MYISSQCVLCSSVNWMRCLSRYFLLYLASYLSISNVCCWMDVCCVCWIEICLFQFSGFVNLRRFAFVCDFENGFVVTFLHASPLSTTGHWMLSLSLLLKLIVNFVVVVAPVESVDAVSFFVVVVVAVVVLAIVVAFTHAHTTIPIYSIQTFIDADRIDTNPEYQIHSRFSPQKWTDCRLFRLLRSHVPKQKNCSILFASSLLSELKILFEHLFYLFVFIIVLVLVRNFCVRYSYCFVEITVAGTSYVRARASMCVCMCWH